MLTKVRRYAISGTTLTLRNAVGRELAKLGAESQQLAGTSWRVSAYNNGKQAVVNVESGTKVTAAFSAAGVVSGSGGCNSYNGTYQASASKLSIGPISATQKSCPTPEGVMTQEQAFLAALGTAHTYRVEAGKLEIRTADGALAVEAIRV
jgi:heat shock protein HslJ